MLPARYDAAPHAVAGGALPPLGSYHPPAPPTPQQFFDATRPALEQWFAAVDARGSGKIGVRELQRALALGGLNFSMKLTGSIIRSKDADGSEELDFAEFSALHTELQRLHQTFAGLDAGRSGRLGLPQVHQALVALGFDLDMQPAGAFYTLVRSYDFDSGGAIGLEAFVALVVQLQNARRLFALWDQQGSGRVTLDFSQLVWTIAQL